MENSSHYQKRVIDKIYGKYGRGPLESLEDLCKLHLDYLHNEKDRLIISHFKKEVERNLSLHLASDKGSIILILLKKTIYWKHIIT